MGEARDGLRIRIIRRFSKTCQETNSLILPRFARPLRPLCVMFPGMRAVFTTATGTLVEVRSLLL